MLINHVLNNYAKSLRKQPKEARTRGGQYQPTALFRQEACGFSDAYDKYALDDRIETFIFGDYIYGNHR